MSQRNSEADSAAIGLAMIGAAFFIMFFVFYALVCFAAIIMTIIAFYAAQDGLTVYKWTVTAREARIFLACGIAGLIGLPIFVIFCAALLQTRIPDNWWGYILLGGYSFGALGLGSMIFEAEQEKEAGPYLALPPPAPAAPPSLPSFPFDGLGGAPSGAAAAPFQFASWDDEAPDDEVPTSKPAPRASDGSDCPQCPCHWTSEDINRIVAKYAAKYVDKMP